MTDSVPGWRYVYIGLEGDEVSVKGVSVWQHEWEPLHEAIEVPHPSYPSQRHRLAIYRASTERASATFAAGEVSNGVWCFYEPVSDR